MEQPHIVLFYCADGVKTCRFQDVLHKWEGYVAISYNIISLVTHRINKNMMNKVDLTLGPCKPEVKDTAYNMLVRPKLEYASPI